LMSKIGSRVMSFSELTVLGGGGQRPGAVRGAGRASPGECAAACRDDAKAQAILKRIGA
jgi:hypothetical protein